MAARGHPTSGDQADAGGPFVAHDDMRDYIEALARGQEPPKPATFKLRR